MNPYKKAVIVFSVIMLIFITRFFVFIISVPDECVYHNGKESGFIIKYFYGFTAENGYHPAPNLLNNILTSIIGTVIGLWISSLLKRKNKRTTTLNKANA
jgi:hypothetical protein